MQADEETVAAIARIFARELGVDHIGPDTHFIFSGGDSLNAESLVAAIATEYGVDIRTAVIMDAPTPRAMADLVVTLLAAPPEA